MVANLLRTLEYRRHVAELRHRVQAAPDATSRATYQLLASYWEDKAQQAQRGWLDKPAPQPPVRKPH
jgi:hypothetical protein